MKKKLVLVYFVCVVICSVFAESNDLLSGLDAYSRGDWTVAAESFERALTTMPDDRTESLYWLVMSETSAQNYERALEYADAFLEAAPEDERAAEVIYQKGRLLHVSGDYRASSETFYRFIDEYPDHPKIPSAYYWIGENLYAAGNYAESRKIFSEVVANYPQSGKVTEARYKIVLIDQQSVREELLQIANEAHAAAVQVEKTPESVETEPKPDDMESVVVSDDSAESDVSPSAVTSDSSIDDAPIADDSTLIAEQKRDEYFADRLTALEEKIDEIAATLSRIAEEQENHRIQEQQQAFEQQQKAEQQQKEQEEAERQQLEKRRQELADLKERTQTLEKLYEQRTKGAQ